MNDRRIEQQYSDNDRQLHEAAQDLIKKRTDNGLEGLVKGLDHIIINTEPDNQESAAQELLDYTGLNCTEAFETKNTIVYVLKTRDSADFLVTSRKDNDNPFRDYNLHPKSAHLPNTRLETLVFETPDLEKYVAIQKNLGVTFMTDDIIETENRLFIQSKPSAYTGNSTGFIQWLSGKDSYQTSRDKPLDKMPRKPQMKYLEKIKYLDHIATRVRAENRDKAILEFMNLTNYNFEFAIHLEKLNSITSVTRRSKNDFALVFTSGIAADTSEESMGPTEKFIRNYGTRAHHMAFHTEDIEDTFNHLKINGLEFISELVGSPADGLKQAFSAASPSTLLVNEYIHRFGDFDGFFTRSNTEALTKATEKQ